MAKFGLFSATTTVVIHQPCLFRAMSVGLLQSWNTRDQSSLK